MTKMFQLKIERLVWNQNMSSSLGLLISTTHHLRVQWILEWLAKRKHVIQRKIGTLTSPQSSTAARKFDFVLNDICIK